MAAVLPRPAILVTDDIKANRVAMRQILKNMDADIVEADSGNETLIEMLRNDNIALLLLDVQMPGMNGYEVAELLREEEKCRYVPVIFVTAAYKEEQYVLKGYDSGAVDYIEKPIDREILRSKVRIFLDLYRKQQELESLNSQLKQNYLRLKVEIGERIKAEQSLKKLSEAVRQSPALVLITDVDGNVEFANSTFSRITGFSQEEILGRNLRFHQSGLRSSDDFEEIQATMDKALPWFGELHNEKKDGSYYWSYTTISPLLDTAGVVTNFVCIEEDISLRKEYENRLLKQANFDEITDLPNRILALDRISQAFSVADKDHHMCPLFFIDIDGLRRINETLGHTAGDKVLVEISQRLQELVRAGDTVARIGSDEFLIIPADIDDVNSAAALAQKILSVIELPMVLDTTPVHMSACIGITLSGNFSADPQTAIQNAESAMYRAKEQGNGNYKFFDDEINQSSQRKLQMELLLHKALDEQQMELWFQPIIDTQTGKPVSVEALLRWHCEELGHVSPDEFISVAEATGQINSIGLWVLKQAQFYAKAWQKQFNLDLLMAINVSVNQFYDRRLFDELARLKEQEPETGGCRLELEITERLLLNDKEDVVQQLHDIEAMGFGFSIDDFGTGYSSLSYLKKCPVDTVKIDRSFVHGLPGDLENATLVNAIVAMAHGLNLKVIAEGVETLEQWEFLKGCNCDYLQGYYISRPMPGADFTNYLRSSIEGGSE